MSIDPARDPAPVVDPVEARPGRKWRTRPPADATRPAGTRRAIVLAVALVAVIAGATLARDALADQSPETAPPSAPATNGPDTAPHAAPTLAKHNLPGAADLQWNQPGDWLPTDYTGAGPGTVCLARGLDQAPGAMAGLRREYDLKDRPDGHASATIVEFRTPGEAAQAAQSAAMRLRGCVGELERAGATEVRLIEDRELPMPRDGDAAIVVEYGYAAPGQADPDTGTFDTIAIAWSGRRLALIRMVVAQQENYWAFPGEPKSGLDLHPMLRSLPRVLERLTG